MIRNIIKILLAAVIAFSGITCNNQRTEAGPDGIVIYEENPFYWQLDGKPSLLLGGTSNDNLFQNPGVEEELDMLMSVGGNYVRCTMSSRDSGNVKPYLADEKGKCDLSKPNQVFWDHFSRFLSLTASKRIVVQVELWATYDFYGEYWLHNPYNPANNVNYTAEESGLPEVHDHRGWKKINPFFSTVPALEGNNLLLEIQHEFIDRILAISFAHDHVLYSMDNETNAHPEWGKYWAGYLKTKAKEENKKIYVTEMWDNWDPTGGKVTGISDTQFKDPHPFRERSTPLNTIDHPGIYDFIDISNHNGQSGQVHYETGLWVRNHIEEKDIVRPINNVKIYGGPGGTWNGDDREGKERFWRNIFAGHAAVRFHRPPSGNGISQDARYQIRSARMITEKVDFFSLVPSNDLLGKRESNEAFCLANKKHEYLVYFPSRGEVTLDAAEGDYELHRLDLGSASWENAGSVELPGSIITRTDPCVMVFRRK